MQPIRTFIAIELNDALQRALAQVQAHLQRDPVARVVRWVASENIHLTLKFLGDVDAGHIPALERIIARVCSEFAPFTLTIGGAGAFPNIRKPNVIWVGVRGQVDTAARLAERIDAACATLGFAREERAFTPHLTLGRVKRDALPKERQRIGALVEAMHIGDVGTLHVERVAVMKSDLTPDGSVYTRLAECALTAKDG